ncbi:MAG: hypothetical protein J6I76_17745 [Oribacterium sp.]|nr:hypothetical protein [Oribacterium sp.]
MHNLFNSTFEVELRILCLLASGRKTQLNLEKIISLDFIVCYAECFQLPFRNLHGNNASMYGELANRRELCEEAIKALVTDGLVDVTIDAGYLYSISASGRKYTKKLKSEYAIQYQQIAAEALKSFKKYSDGELSLMIQDNALRALREVR